MAQVYNKVMIGVINQLFQIETKADRNREMTKIQRHLDAIKDILHEYGLEYESPLGQEYNETRTDCEAVIAGTSTERLIVVEVIKPIIRQTPETGGRIVQRGVVVVADPEQSEKGTR